MLAIGEDKNGKKYALPQKKKIGRNDLCPLCMDNGIEIKVKKCKKHREYFL